MKRRSTGEAQGQTQGEGRWLTRVQRHHEERREDVVEHLAEGLDLAALLVHVVQPRNLDQPAQSHTYTREHV